MSVWVHARKGRMSGEIVWTSDDGEWIDIELDREQKLTLVSRTSDPWRFAGDVERVRAAFLTEVSE